MLTKQNKQKKVNSLLKNSITELIPYQAPLTEIEGNHNAVTKSKHSIDRNMIRLDALKVSELLSWHNYSTKFYLSMDILSEYEGASRRARSRMKNVVSMLGEKVKSLNIHNLTPSELVALSRDLKQSYETISSEQHLKEYELQNQRREFMKHTPMQPKTPYNIVSPLAPTNMMLNRAVSAGTYLGNDNDITDHGYGISFGSMASLSMMDIQPGNFSRNHSLHSLSPSLDGTESIIAKHRKKSGTIKGSGLKLLTDESTLSAYLDPAKREKELKESHERQKSLSTSHRHQSNRSISRSHSHRRIASMKRDNNKRNSPVLGPKKATSTSKYGHYSAFTNSRLKNTGSNRSTHSTTRGGRSALNHNQGRSHRVGNNHGNGRSHRHQKNSSISSNKSTSKSTYNLYSKHRSGGHYKNDSMNSISSLSRVGDGANGGSKLQLSDLNESYDDDDDNSTVIVNGSPKKDRKITFDLDGQSGIPMFSPPGHDTDLPKLQEEKALSNDILSFFAM